MEELVDLLKRIDERLCYMEVLGVQCRSFLSTIAGWDEEEREKLHHLAEEIVDELHNFTSQQKKREQQHES